MNKKVSVIIPFVNEFPQVMFTIRSVYEALEGHTDFEVIAVNNYCDEVKAQRRDEDKSYQTIKAAAAVNKSWLRVLDYKEKLSHWQAKNLGVQASTGKILWFCDAHCIAPRDDLANMVDYFEMMSDQADDFTLHLPLTYQILDSRRLIYKLVIKPFSCEYRFTSYPFPDGELTEVPVMSTCGMMMSRGLFDEIGGFPKELGIYGGGEQYINFVLATLGKKKFIWPATHALYHHGEKRGYNWNSYDMLRNRAIACYMYADAAFLAMFISTCRTSKGVKQKIYNDVLSTCSKHRAMLVPKRVMSIGEWVHNWEPEAVFN